MPSPGRMSCVFTISIVAWLGEELEPTDGSAFAPRCVKDVVEGRLLERRRDLFSDFSASFMDTTTLSFQSLGGDWLGGYGHSAACPPTSAGITLLER